VVILCGGRGSRLQEHTSSVPKPLVEIGGRPIVWHVVQIYLAQGFRRFLLLTGYRSEQIEQFVDETPWPAGTDIACLDTGETTPTGGRLHRAAGELAAEPFCLTYADGLADIDLGGLLADHAGHGAPATMTVVRPRLPFGVAHIAAGDVVSGFSEKPRSEHWVNAGFFCLEPSVLEHLDDEAVFEREPLERLAAAGALRAHRHDGFWHCMDTLKDTITLNDLWAAGEAPWLPAARLSEPDRLL
jgi:glucose-1-phosphate cytidylyltransferase